MTETNHRELLLSVGEDTRPVRKMLACMIAYARDNFGMTTQALAADANDLRSGDFTAVIDPGPVDGPAVGSPARKIQGYPFPGEVRAIFTNRSGQTRYVVEATGEDYVGMLHIFNGSQLTFDQPAEDDRSGQFNYAWVENGISFNAHGPYDEELVRRSSRVTAEDGRVVKEREKADWERGILVKDTPEKDKPYHGMLPPKSRSAAETTSDAQPEVSRDHLAEIALVDTVPGVASATGARLADALEQLKPYRRAYDGRIYYALPVGPAKRDLILEALRAYGAVKPSRVLREGYRPVPEGQTPLDENLHHPLLEVFNGGMKAFDEGTTNPYHPHSLEGCLHSTGWVHRDLRVALDKARADARGA